MILLHVFMGFMSALSCLVLWYKAIVRHPFRCLFSAVYLADILTLSTLSILIVIWLAKMTSSEEGMSSCSRSLALCLAKISCCNRRSCCCRKGKVTTLTRMERKEEFYENKSGFFFQNEGQFQVESTPDYESDDDISWQDFARHLDHCFFVIFFFLILFASTALFIVWDIEYEKSSDWKDTTYIFFYNPNRLFMTIIFVVHLH